VADYFFSIFNFHILKKIAPKKKVDTSSSENYEIASIKSHSSRVHPISPILFIFDFVKYSITIVQYPLTPTL
jgi:hypothetical protein